MKTILRPIKHSYWKRISFLLIVIALVAGMVGCNGGPYDLTMAVYPVGSGTATDQTGGSPYEKDEQVLISATPAPCYRFHHWTMSGGGTFTGNPTTFTMPARDVTVTAHFEPTNPLDHFKCYNLSSAPLNEVVYLEDQFGAVNATVTEACYFGNPVKKVHGETTLIGNPDHHLTVYNLNLTYEEPPMWRVWVDNQFGTENLTVSGPVALAVPTQKLEPVYHEEPECLAHFLLYEVIEGPSVDAVVSLQDEFDYDLQEAMVYEPVLFANPVRKTHDGEVTEIPNVGEHLVFYEISTSGGGGVPPVEVDNQFGLQTLDIEDVGLLAVPSEKINFASLPPPHDEIVIGMSRSITGNLSVIHNNAFGPIYPIYTAMVNSRTTPGIDVDGTYFPMDYVDLNDNSVGNFLIANTQTLIKNVEDGEVHTIFGPTCTHMIDIMAPICNNAGCVLMTAEGGATFLEAPGYLPEWPYVFVNLSYSNRCQLLWLAALVEQAHEAYTGQDNDVKAFIYYQDDAHGLEYLATAEAIFPYFGAIVGSEAVLDPASGGSTDYNTAIELAHAANPDMVCCFCYPDEVMGLTSAAIANDYNFNAWVGGPGANFGYFGLNCQGDVEDIICFATANENTSPAMWDLFNVKLAPLGFGGLDFWGHPLYWAALEIWEEAISEAGVVVNHGPPATFAVSQDDIKDQLRTYDSPAAGHYATTILGKTYYDFLGTGGGILSCDCHTGEIGQWQADGTSPCGYYVEIVGGNICTSTLKYPKDDWSDGN